MSAAGIRRVPIQALSHGSSDFLLVGVIIAKQNPRTIKSKIAGSPDRCVWNFTLRDSPANYINVSYWGSPEFMENMARTFHIGDIVDIIKAKATYMKNDNANFLPEVTSPLLLTMTENFSEMCLHSEDDCAEFHRLLRLPTRPPSDYLTLSDIHSNGQALRGKEVNLLAAVYLVGALRHVKTKLDGRDLECREVELMDQSPTSLYMQLWDVEMTYRADNWKPRETVLFIADVRLDWSTYKKCITATATNRTIITENPLMAEANTLRQHARTTSRQPTAVMEYLATSYTNPSNIVTIMSCGAVWNKANNNESAGSFTALVMAAVIDLDLDGLIPQTAIKCTVCHMIVDENIGLCLNPDCPTSSGDELPTTQRVFDVKVSLSDHTGCLPNCQINPNTAETIFKCKPDAFECMSGSAKTALKWKFLFKKCACKMIILPTSHGRLSPLICIVDLERVSLHEYAAKLPMY